MISIPYTRDDSGKIFIERDLTEIEKQKLVRHVININSVDYYFIEDNVENEFNIDEYKKLLINKIDSFIQEEIAKGSEYNGRIYSMSTNAQLDWSNILAVPDMMFPFDIMSVNEELYSLPLSEKEAFYYTCLNYKYTQLKRGHTLKSALKLLNTEQEVLSFVIE